MRIVSMYVVCEDDQAHEIASKLQNVVLGFGLDGYESGMTMQAHDENTEAIVFNPDGED